MKDKYKYLVTYICETESGKGVGRQIFTMKKKITGVDDIRLVEAAISGKDDKNPVVLNYILMDTKWGVWEWLSAIAELALLVFCILALIASVFG